MTKSALIILCFLPALQSDAQMTNGNEWLDSSITSVKFHLRNDPLSFPVADLKAPDGSLVLEFDHIGAELVDYLYTIEHCDHDWSRSSMLEQEFISGFLEDRILQTENSQSTRMSYVHYKLGLPNRNMRWLLSGNYLLKVYDVTYGKNLVLVRRFQVVEPLWAVNASFVPVAQVGKINSHHEIDFLVNHKNTRIVNPQNDVKAYVLQNQRWDKAIGPLQPIIIRNEQLVFDYQDSIVFPAGVEWRFFDIRTFSFRGENVKIIEQKYDHFEVTLFTDEPRADKRYVFQNDLNGHYVIDNQTPNQTLLQCDYAYVLFSVKQNLPFDEEDVYVFGELSNWQIHPRFRMQYIPEADVYAVEIPLKQGYYNYQYLLVNHETGSVDEEGLEGNWYETGNDYQILVYYRPFGARYDRLMAYGALDSQNRN